MLTLADIDAMFPETHVGSVFSDMYKDAYGIRPRHTTFESLEHFDREFERVCNEASDQIALEREQTDLAIAEFESQVERAMKLGARNRETAIRWITDGTAGDDTYESLEFELDLPFGYIKQSLEAR